MHMMARIFSKGKRYVLSTGNVLLGDDEASCSAAGVLLDGLRRGR